MKISIITPSFNSGDTLERAIQSVRIQGYDDVEHIVVDGGSTDGTLDILRRHPSVRYVSEPDNGQADAINKGFAMSTGEVVSLLNADDYYLEGAFATVAEEFRRGAQVVMGKVLVKTYTKNGVSEWLNDPSIDFDAMLRHWQPNAFCVNPVGYFYKREVQETIAFNIENDDKQDLEFLLEASLRFRFSKVKATLGVFSLTQDTKTGRLQASPSYWNKDNFSFVGRLARTLPERERRVFEAQRDIGYHLRRHYVIDARLKEGGDIRELLAAGEAFLLPQEARDIALAGGRFVEHNRIAAKGDVVLCVVDSPLASSRPTLDALTSDAEYGGYALGYGVDPLCRKLGPGRSTQHETPAQLATEALLRILKRHKDEFLWRIIVPVPDPLDAALREGNPSGKGTPAQAEREAVLERAREIAALFDSEFMRELGVDVFAHPFDIASGIALLEQGNVTLLLYTAAAGAPALASALREFWGDDSRATDAAASAMARHMTPDETALSRLCLGADDLARLYDSRYAQHFFKPEHLALRMARHAAAQSPVPASPYHGLIYDVGLHEAQDTEFYLKKGFRVVAIDANPVMIERARKRFAREIASGQLVLLNCGIVKEDSGAELDFYISTVNSEWSSFIKSIAERDGSISRVISVPCRTLGSIVDEYGEPHYIKIDIEGHDSVALQSLANSKHKARYISVENGNAGMLDTLAAAGYARFKYVQQNNMPSIVLPRPALEGEDVAHTFVMGSSGPFGEETLGPWLSYDAAFAEIAKVWNPVDGTKRPGHDDAVHGWFDLHAALPTVRGEGAEQSDTRVLHLPEPVSTKAGYANLLEAHGQIYRKDSRSDPGTLKRYQDLAVIDFLLRNIAPGARILEIGGGYSRVFNCLREKFEFWNLDKFEGLGTGPVSRTQTAHHTVLDYIGAFNPELPDSSFDAIISVSVLEHVPRAQDQWARIALDMKRVAKPNALSFHCIDAILRDGKVCYNGIADYMGAHFMNLNGCSQEVPLSISQPLLVLEKEEYDRTWLKITKQPYEQFGAPFSLNSLCRIIK